MVYARFRACTHDLLHLWSFHLFHPFLVQFLQMFVALYNVGPEAFEEGGARACLSQNSEDH